MRLRIEAMAAARIGSMRLAALGGNAQADVPGLRPPHIAAPLAPAGTHPRCRPAA